ncbi:MAG: YkvA family protein [Chloroflexota bacterium]
MGLGKLVGMQIGNQVLKRASGGRIKKVNKIQAIMRLPFLLRLGYSLFRDERVPAWQRAGTVALLAFIFSPLDFIGDIPIVGQFWDFTMAVVVLDAFFQAAPAKVVNEHIKDLGLEKKIPLR